MRTFIIGTILCFPALATTTIDRIDVTPQQAIVRVKTDQTPSTCVIHASFGTSLSTDIPDIADNGSTTSRIGTLVSGKYVKFVIGKRRGNWSLAASNTYTAGVTCGADSQVTKTFTTKPIPWGNSAPCTIKWNANKPFFADYAAIDWNPANESTMYTDPCTGAEWYLHNTVGFAAASIQLTGLIPAHDLDGGGTWTNLGNIGTTGCTPGSTCTHGSGGPSDKLFVPLNKLPPAQESGNTANFANLGRTDDVTLDVWCGNSAQNETLTIQYSIDHGATVVGTPQTAICPTGAFAKIKTVPSANPQPGFAGWGYNPDVTKTGSYAGTCNTNGTIVTATSGFFYTGADLGSVIRIDGFYRTITAIDSPTQIEVSDDLGVQTGLTFQTVQAGFVITKSGTGGLDLALGLTYYSSRGAGWGQNGDWSQVNPIPVTVSFAADGTTPITPTKGYFAYVTANTRALESAIYLWIPLNADGTVRNETRLLAMGEQPKSYSNVHTNGDAGIGSNPSFIANDQGGAVWDGINATTVYATDLQVPTRLWKMVYTTDGSRTVNGHSCVNFPAYSNGSNLAYHTIQNGTPTKDCFDYYNMTPGGYPAMIRSAYATANPTIGNPSWMSGNTLSGVLGGKAVAQVYKQQEGIGVVGLIDLSGTVGTVSKVWDTFSGNPDNSVGRWGSIHSCQSISTQWTTCSFNKILDNGNSVPLNGSWTMPVSRISRVDFGTADAWGTNVALSNGEAYNCPTSVTPEYSIIAGTKSCVHMEFSRPPCDTTPYTGTSFFGGQTEAQKFPCSTPDGNGGTLGVVNAAWSKLQDLRAGDCFEDTAQAQNELFCIVTDPQYVAVNQIQVWASRWNYWRWISRLFDPGDGSVNTNDLRATHGSSWTAQMSPSYSTNGSNQGTGLLMPLNGSSEMVTFSATTGCHSVVTGEQNSNNITLVQDGCAAGQLGFLDKDPILMGNGGAGKLTRLGLNPGFAGVSLNGSGFPQSYPSITDPTVQGVPIYSDYHHLNPGGGNAGELYNIANYSNNPVAVAGTTHTYRINASNTPTSKIFKTLGFYGHAGRFVLQNLSGNTYSSDMPDYSFCVVLNAGECVQNASNSSTVGQVYVTVPSAYLTGGCLGDQMMLPSPCVFALMPHWGTIDLYRADAQTGFATFKKLGFAHTILGGQYQFSNCRWGTSDFLLCVSNWADNKYMTWISYRVRPAAGFDGLNHTTFQTISPSIQGVSWAAYARARFGYLEDGTNPASNTYRCAEYANDCSTDPPASSGEPYSFVTSWDVGARVACTAGQQCPMTINAISGRVLYYVIDRLAADGTVLSTSAPLGPIAVP